MAIHPDIDKQLSILKRGAVDVISEDELRRKLEASIRANKPLVVKAGFDPTAPDIHLGHTVLLRKLRQFQDLGHTVVFLIGDFTARIGDPSGRSEKRKRLTAEEVQANAVTYRNQVAKILDLERLKTVFNSEWFDRMSVPELLELTAHVSVNQILARADFKKRIGKGETVSLLEFMYPLLQGYDSVKLQADIELGGTDQIFNLLVGRDLQTDFGLPQQVVMTMPLLEGTDGVQKMSKSYGNYIGIAESAGEMFGKLMSVSDPLMLKYYELLTDEDLDAVRRMHPREAKVRLGELVAGQYHGSEAARAAREEFERVFASGQVPDAMPELSTDGTQTVVAIMVQSGLAGSGNEARRLIKQGAVSFNEARITDEAFAPSCDGILKVGARRFLRIKRGSGTN